MGVKAREAAAQPVVEKDRRWRAALPFVVVLLTIGALAVREPADPDLWWHLASTSGERRRVGGGDGDIRRRMVARIGRRLLAMGRIQWVSISAICNTITIAIYQ